MNEGLDGDLRPESVEPELDSFSMSVKGLTTFTADEIISTALSTSVRVSGLRRGTDTRMYFVFRCDRDVGVRGDTADASEYGSRSRVPVKEIDISPVKDE